MKQTIRAALAVLLALALCACSAAKAPKEPTAQELYQRVMEQNKTLEKLNAHLEMQMQLEMEGGETSSEASAEAPEGEEPLLLNVTGDVLGENVGKPEMRMAMPMQMDMLGITVETSTWFADGYLLMDMVGTKVKAPIPLEKALEQFSAADVQPLDYVSDLAMTKDETTGLYTVTYAMDMEKAMELSASYMGGLIGEMDESQQFTWEHSNGSLVADAEGNLVSQQMDTAFSYELEGVPVHCTMQMDYVYNEIPADFAVEIPDAGEFVEVTAEQLGLAA